MFDYTKYCLPISTELKAMDGKTLPNYLVGYNQHRGVHILLKDGSVKTFFRDEIKEIKPINNPGFPYKENSGVMAIRTEQSQQWNPDLLPKFIFGVSKEYSFSGTGPTKQSLENYEKEIKKPTRSKPRQRDASSHWVGMQ